MRYRIEGDDPPWRPVNAYDDGRKLYIEFAPGIVQGELPPLFVIGSDGAPEIVNYRAFRNILIVDRLFAAAELRLGGDEQRKVRIVTTDGASLPAGGAVIGIYDSQVTAGQSCVLLIWTRLIMPNGRSIVLNGSRAPTLRAIQVSDEVDNHLRQLVGAALLSMGSEVNAGTNLNTNNAAII